jgi:hypothetical protein
MLLSFLCDLVGHRAQQCIGEIGAKIAHGRADLGRCVIHESEITFRKLIADL